MLDMQWLAKQTRNYAVCTRRKVLVYVAMPRSTVTTTTNNDTTSYSFSRHTRTPSFPIGFSCFFFLVFEVDFSCFSSSTIYNRFSSFFLRLFPFILRSSFAFVSPPHHCCWHRYVACSTEHIKTVQVYFCSRSTLITSSFDSLQHQLLFVEFLKHFHKTQKRMLEKRTQVYSNEKSEHTHTRSERE